MPEAQIDLIHLLLAAAPIIVVLVLMLGFHWSGAWAGAAGLLAALLAGVFGFGADGLVILVALERSLLLTFYILYVIWPGLFLYNLVKETGGIDVIAGSLLRLSPHPVMQLLVPGWVFSAFLEGISGFGIPIAVAAPMLMSAGFSPVTSVAVSAIGHAWAVTFGSFGIGFVVLMTASQESAQSLGSWTAIMIGVACLLTGFAAAHLHQGRRSLVQALPAVLVIGIAMAGSLYLLVVSGLYMLAGFGSGLAGLGASVIVSRLPFYRQDIPQAAPTPVQNGKKSLSLSLAGLPYLLVLGLVVCAQFVPFLKNALNQVLVKVALPETVTRLGWVTPAGEGKVTSLLGDPGGLMLISIGICFLLYRLTGHLEKGALRRVLAATVQNAGDASLGITFMVALAMIMVQTGMPYTLAVGFSQLLSSVFPLVTPFIGLLGSFVTGSNSSSNVMFAMLQKQSALLLQLAVPVIIGAQTAGGAMGSMMAPAKVIVGCTTAGLTGQEGKVMRRTVPYALIITAVLGLIALLAA